MSNITSSIKNAWKIPDLRKKVLLTVLMLLIYRLGSFIPVPGISRDALASLVSTQGSLFGFMDIVSGGAFSKASIFAMSISPYINASIIMQLLTVAIPALERMSKEGEEGRKKIAQWVRYATVVLGFLQALGLYTTLRSKPGTITDPGIMALITITLTFTAGTAFLMWLGEQINEYGIGNGISLIIFGGIISRGPNGLMALIGYKESGMLGKGFLGYLSIIGIIAIFLIVIALVVFIQQAERRIPVQYAKRVVGRKMYGGQNTHIPIKVNTAGVIPIIFAMSILAFPSTIIGFINATPESKFFQYLLNMQGKIEYSIIMALMVMFFTFFYTMIVFNPIELSNNIKKNGGFVPGIRPGKPTSEYIAKVVNRITWFGGLFLALITVLPSVLQQITKINGVWFGGTAVLIMVGVALETVKQIESQMLMRHYKGFLD